LKETRCVPFIPGKHPEVVIILDTISLGFSKAENPAAGMLSYWDKMQAVNNENQ